ncbi:MAG TPA: hypothetical protein VFQ25_13025 [Ktedonobacterales bacterium]|nr:hypothetical protein [Ktedonobacterales bacterium]
MAGRGGKRAKPERRDGASDVSLDEAVEELSAWKPGKRARRNPFPLVAGALAAALLLVGVASYFAASLLGDAVRVSARRGAETPSALSATICADLIHQNYGDLVARVDPKPAPPAATGAFDAGALTQQLHTLDRENGPVISCAAAPLDPNLVDLPNGPDGALRLLLTLGRSGTPRPIAAVLITRTSPEGAWVIERDSSFLLAT